MKAIHFARFTALALLLASRLPAGAQWMTQTVAVSNGWTAVYLYVDASSQHILPTTQNLPISPDNPIDQIWLWKTPVSAAQYITTPEAPLSSGGQWLTWSRTNLQNTLSALIPNAAYLIHSTAATNYHWKILGQPVPYSYTWDMTGLNLIGFPTPSVNPPNFQDFFAQDPAIASLVQIFQYVGGDFSTNPANPARVFSEYNTPVTRGEAYWISATNAYNAYYGPFNVNLPSPGGLKYGVSGGQITFHLVNTTPNPLTVSLAVLPSEPPPFGQSNIVAAPPILLEGALNSSNLTYAYTSLPANSSPSASWTLPPAGQSGSDVAVVLGVNRFAMNSSPGALYAGILQFTDSLGFSQINVPVSATVANNAGLWVGSASVTGVSYDLKSYATNADGSLMISAVTNSVATTNWIALGPTTNLLINNFVTTNQAINFYQVTNEVISTYTTEAYQFGTNAFVLTTNEYVNATALSQEVIETDVVGYYYTNNGGLLVWVTTNTDYPLVTLTSSVSTNQSVVTNLIGAVPTNGTPVVATNWVFFYSASTNQLITNGVFMSPVTNLEFDIASNTNFVVVTNMAYNLTGSNLVATGFASNDQVVVSDYLITNGAAVSQTAVTNYFPAPQPIFETTNGSQLIFVNVITNNYLVNNWFYNYFTTNYQVISNSFQVVAGVTNPVASNTNLVNTWYGQTSSLTTNFSTMLSLAISTNAAYLVVTNPLVTSVSNYVVTAHNTALDAVTTPYPLRLIIFNDGSGKCSLLQRVYYGIRQNTNIVVATTESVLDPGHLNSARRITATQLPWTQTNATWQFTGGPLAQGATLATTVFEPYDDQAANPFLHTYHPDHNNLDFNFYPPHELPVGSESYNITRQISLAVEASGTDFLSLTTANSSLSGTYSETITLTGLGGATKSYQTSGAFTLKQVSTISTLTTQ